MPNNSTIHIWLHIKDNARTHARTHTLFSQLSCQNTDSYLSLPSTPSFVHTSSLCIYVCGYLQRFSVASN